MTQPRIRPSLVLDVTSPFHDDDEEEEDDDSVFSFCVLLNISDDVDARIGCSLCGGGGLNVTKVRRRRGGDQQL